MGSCRHAWMSSTSSRRGGGEKDRQRFATAWSQAGRARDSHDGCAGPEGIVPAGGQAEIIRS